MADSRIFRKIFVTTALPYANGAFHLGHIMEYIQADIWVRFQRMRDNIVYFVSADDAHGAPIMLAAEQAGVSPSEFVANVTKTRQIYFDGFSIGFDHWHTTDSTENFCLSQSIYKELVKAGFIECKTVEQFFDPVKAMFLPDRFIKGECPKCGTLDQYGDSCEVCGGVYSTTEIKNPYSILSKSKPELRSSEHYFFRLSDPRCTEFLREWIVGLDRYCSPRLQAEVEAKAREWLGKKDASSESIDILEDWDISRDAPYFGIPIPDTVNKYFYVWLDAPIGYLASLQAYCDKVSLDFNQIISDPDLEQIHFIGKDIIYFHVLFWPAMLKFAQRKTPDRIFVHGFITTKGEKMSKSRGTGIDPLLYLKSGMNPDWLRYYLFSKINRHVEDIDFSAEDFISRINSDLIGKYVNIASRASKFLTQYFNGNLANFHEEFLNQNDIEEVLHVPLGIETGFRSYLEIINSYEKCDYSKAAKYIMTYADGINKYFDEQKPWLIAKDFVAGKNQLQQICSACLRAFFAMTILLKPVLPNTTKKVEDWFNTPNLSLADLHPVSGRIASTLKVKPYEHLMSRVTEDHLVSLFNTK